VILKENVRMDEIIASIQQKNEKIVFFILCFLEFQLFEPINMDYTALSLWLWNLEHFY